MSTIKPPQWARELNRDILDDAHWARAIRLAREKFRRLARQAWETRKAQGLVFMVDYTRQQLADRIAYSSAIMGDLTPDQIEYLIRKDEKAERTCMRMLEIARIAADCTSCSKTIQALGIVDGESDVLYLSALEGFRDLHRKMGSDNAKEDFLRAFSLAAHNGVATTISVNEHGNARLDQQGFAAYVRPKNPVGTA